MQRDAKKVLTLTALSLFFGIIVIYAIFGAKDVIIGIKIRDVSIKDGQVYTEGLLPVSGIAKNALKLTLNGREISIDQSGKWQETIALSPGYNLVSITAWDKFGNQDQKIYKLTYSPKTEENQNGKKEQEGS